MASKRITVEAAAAGPARVSNTTTQLTELSDKVDNLTRLVELLLSEKTSAPVAAPPASRAPKPAAKTGTVVRKILPKTYWQTKVCLPEQIELYKLVQSGGSIGQWIEALSIPRDLREKFTTIVSNSDKWTELGCLEKNEDGVKLPPQIEDLFTKSDLCKGKKAVFTLAWDQYMSKSFKELMKEIMNALESQQTPTPIEEMHLDDVDGDEAATADDTKGKSLASVVNFEDSD